MDAFTDAFPELFLNPQSDIPLTGRGIYFVRTAVNKVNEKTPEADICMGELRLSTDGEGGNESNPMADLDQVLGKVFIPLLRHQTQEEWKQDSSVQCEAGDADLFFEKAATLQDTLADAIANLRDKDVRLAVPTIRWGNSTIENKKTITYLGCKFNFKSDIKAELQQRLAECARTWK